MLLVSHMTATGRRHSVVIIVYLKLEAGCYLRHRGGRGEATFTARWRVEIPLAFFMSLRGLTTESQPRWNSRRRETSRIGFKPFGRSKVTPLQDFTRSDISLPSSEMTLTCALLFFLSRGFPSRADRCARVRALSRRSGIYLILQRREDAV